MIGARRKNIRDGLYERLLQRLAVALDEADTAGRLCDEQVAELELKGLTPAELELIRAYLARDMDWLRGWHAAAEEWAAVEAQAGAAVNGGPPRVASPTRSQALCCSMCGTPVVSKGRAAKACVFCGSRHFRPLELP